MQITPPRRIRRFACHSQCPRHGAGPRSRRTYPDRYRLRASRNRVLADRYYGLYRADLGASSRRIETLSPSGSTVHAPATALRNQDHAPYRRPCSSKTPHFRHTHRRQTPMTPRNNSRSTLKTLTTTAENSFFSASHESNMDLLKFLRCVSKPNRPAADRAVNN